jgi:hypothetical protein
MSTKLVHCLNRPVYVAIPALFGDDRPRVCTLVDIEQSGLWLDGEALKGCFGTADTEPPSLATATAFFPFSQILYLFDATQLSSLSRGVAASSRSVAAASAPKQRAPPPRPPDDATPDEGQNKGRSTQKGSKPRR